jgi:glycyl-tRNA synthetase
VKGLFDYGPVGTAIKNNMFRLWREHFILEDDMLEVSCPNLTPYIVLKNSGHVDRFSDILVKDVKTNDPHRADHLLEEWIAKQLNDPKVNATVKEELTNLRVRVEEMKVPEISETIKKYKIKSPDTGNDLSEPEDFNLMFKTHIGPASTDNVAYLRPETAQSLITNFKRLYEFNYAKLPFAAATIGIGFRNEISPRQSILRVREFEMGEIEHFVDPLDKSHEKYHLVKNVEVAFWSAKSQFENVAHSKMKMSDALENKVLLNETMAYFIARVYQFMKLIGLKEDCIRFRQHKPKEMAHYAIDCWDCELMTSYGWVECVGIADRSAYDLESHSKGIKKPIVAARQLAQPRQEDQVKINLQKGEIAKLYKKEAAIIFEHIENLSNDDKHKLKESVESGNDYKFTEDQKEFVLVKAHFCDFKVTRVNVIEEKFIPGVIEPSFGFGRICYALLEQNFFMRDERRTMFNLPPEISPIKCSILPLMPKEELLKFVAEIGILSLRVREESEEGRPLHEG